MLKYSASLFGEVLIVLLFFVISNNFLAERPNLIEADGRGYYEFLPATFIYDDLTLSYLDTLQTDFYDDQMISEEFYPKLENGQRYDKYFLGTAILQAPFFGIGHAWAHISPTEKEDGFSKPYQQSIFIGSLFYALFGLVFLRLLLETFDVQKGWIWLLQVGTFFGGSLLNYVQWDAAYSHAYSFFLIAGFLYFARAYLLENKPSQIFWTVFFLGFICLVRPVNLLIICFVPLLTTNINQLVYQFKMVFTRHWKIILGAIVVILSIAQIQCWVWYQQTGNWIHYAYGDESFIWSEPHIIDFLFSYRKGFFLWAPWFFLIISYAIVYYIRRKNVYRLITFLCGFGILIYVLSSWWYWSYGGSIGARPMVDFYPAFLLFVAPAFNRNSGMFKSIFLLTTPIFMYIMAIQTYQYQKGILTLDQMDKTSYWKVFLKTDPMYEYYLWKEEIPLQRKIASANWVKHANIIPNTWYVSDTLRVNLPTVNSPTKGQVTFQSDQKSGAEILEIRLLAPNDSLLFNQYSTLLHTIVEKGKKNRIDFRFEIQTKLPQQIKAVFIMNTKNSKVILDSMKIRFFTDSIQ